MNLEQMPGLPQKPTGCPGIYLHIPYCRQACSYCNFYFSTNTSSAAALVGAICKEIRTSFKDWHGSRVETVYLGGGTPSLLDERDINLILNTLGQYYNLNLKECTIECNPEDITPVKLSNWKNMGINRLSLGVQALDNDLLQLLNRRHTVAQILQALDSINQQGFQFLTIDLIFGIPNMSEGVLIKGLDLLGQFQIPHLSAYALTVEEKTLLWHQVNKKQVAMPNDESFRAQYDLVKCFAASHGLVQYEISNYAKPGFEAIHNTRYWNGYPYLGFGPSAHSYLHPVRRWNIANLHRYINMVSNGETYWEQELLGAAALYNEYIITRIRTTHGLDLAQISSRFGPFNVHFTGQLLSLAQNGLVAHEGNQAWLTSEGEFLCDYVSKQLMWIDE